MWNIDGTLIFFFFKGSCGIMVGWCYKLGHVELRWDNIRNWVMWNCGGTVLETGSCGTAMDNVTNWVMGNFDG